MMYTITFTGLTELMERATAAGANIVPLRKAALTKSAALIQQTARHNLDRHHRTGTLQRSILFTVTDPIATVEVNERYGLYIEQGTPPHIIEPKNKKALFWKGAAHPVRRVNHPGTRADPFFERAIEESQPAIQANFQTVADVITTQMEGH